MNTVATAASATPTMVMARISSMSVKPGVRRRSMHIAGLGLDGHGTRADGDHLVAGEAGLTDAIEVEVEQRRRKRRTSLPGHGIGARPAYRAGCRQRTVVRRHSVYRLRAGGVAVNVAVAERHGGRRD